MDVAASMLNYWIVTSLAALLCIWACGSAVPKVREHDRSHRLWTLLGAALLLPTFAAATLANPLGCPELAYGAVLLPAVVVCNTWSNMITLRDQSPLLKVLHLPTLFLNATLVGLYSVRIVQDFLGEDIGTWGGALTLAHLALQTQVGCAEAVANPIWLHLPFLMPLCLRFRWYHVTALITASTLSTALLVLLFAAMPMAYTRASSYRNPPPQDSRLEITDPNPEVSRRARPVGVKVPWGQRVLPASTLWEVRQALAGLQVTTVTVDVSGDTFENEALHHQITAELAWARSQGLHVTVICRRSSLQMLPSASLEDLRQKLAETQWLAAENLKPSLLVLFSGPFGRLAEATHKRPSLDAWMRAIRQCAREAKQANPKVQVAVAIESLGPHAGELFRRLRAADSPVDVVGLNIFPRGRLIPDLDRDLSRLRSLIAHSEGDRPIQIFETGATPHGVGGELGQWHFLVRILGFANRTDGIVAICIDALSDPRTARGLLNWTGRRRLAFRLLSASAKAARPGK